MYMFREKLTAKKTEKKGKKAKRAEDEGKERLKKKK